MAIGGKVDNPQVSNSSYTQHRERQKVEIRLETKLHAVNDVVLEGLDGHGPMPVDLRLKGVPDVPEGNVERAFRVSEA